MFLPYMGMAAILFSDAEPFEQCQHSFERRPHMKSGENWSSSFKEGINIFQGFQCEPHIPYRTPIK